MSLAGGKLEGVSGSKLGGDSGSGSKLEGDSGSKLEGDSGSKLEGDSGSGSKLEGAMLLVVGGNFFGVVVFHTSVVNWRGYICPKCMCILLYVKHIGCSGIQEMYGQLEESGLRICAFCYM